MLLSSVPSTGLLTDKLVSAGNLWLQVGLAATGDVSEEGATAASKTEPDWTGSAQNKLAPETQKKSESGPGVNQVP